VRVGGGGVVAFDAPGDAAAAAAVAAEPYTCTPKMGSSSMTDVGVEAEDAKTNWDACGCRALGAVGGQQRREATLRTPEAVVDSDGVIDSASWLVLLPLLLVKGDSLAAPLRATAPTMGAASCAADPDPLEQLDVTVRIGGGRRLTKEDCAANLGVDKRGGLVVESSHGRHDGGPCLPLSRSSSQTLTAQT
jgi:hypothetical protein